MRTIYAFKKKESIFSDKNYYRNMFEYIFFSEDAIFAK